MSIKKNRIDKIKSYVSPQNISILEIGALDSPTFASESYKIKFLDFASAEELSMRGKGNLRYSPDNLVRVDYICPTLNYSEYVFEKFDLVIANHVVEHVVDTIKWLSEVKKLLKKDGILFLSVPDKRYTFDIMRNNTTFIDVLYAYENKIEKPTFYNILEHFYYHKSVNTNEVYDNKHLDKIQVNRFTPKEAIEVALKFSKQDYADVHCNVYTDYSFQDLIQVLIDLGKVELKLLEVSKTIKYSNEFYAIFKN